MGLMVRSADFGSGKRVEVYEYLRSADGMMEVGRYEVEINVDGLTDEQWVRISPAEARKLAAILSSVADEYEKGGTV